MPANAPRTIEIDNQVVNYTDDTPFVVEKAHDDEHGGKWQPRYRCEGKPTQAVRLYDGVNIGNGYRKRLCVVVNGRRRVLASDESHAGW